MSLNTLVVLMIVGGWLSGRAAVKFRLPAVIGMTFWGIALAYFFKTGFPEVIWDLEPFLKSLALIVILLRAGLGIEKETLEKVGRSAILMSFIPCVFEGAAVAVICRYFLSFSWAEAGMMGFILAAVSPAVVVPSMLTLKEQGYGNKNETPTLILAGASLDNVMAITLFTVFLSLGRQGSVSYLRSAASIPYAVVVGAALGFLAGMFLSWFFKKHFHRIRATEKAILVIGSSVLLVQVGACMHVAALLGIMTMGFILLERAEMVAHELAAKLGKVWVLAEIILFVLIGMAVDLDTVVKAGGVGLIVIMTGIAARSLGVLTTLFRSRFNMKERLFCVIAYVPKATVQAALGAIPLLAGVKNGEVILSIAVLSICFTTPLGLLGIRYFAPKLLSIDIKSDG
ncbi:MAG: cation:proton antiporter [Candidatus Omnitrophica bacterium]|nr:cation:proton antiporter [Candidatus Omnitrophota bacterium]MDD4013118.1 cation:proton antiporter [Candidatus Omnitrophota bacterium]